ncbi:hypothetical protein B0042_1875 [Bifidobacterium adolescentis]|nr:hypothetical protein B0042_1875 [Bifidobacterium adolescentis]
MMCPSGGGALERGTQPGKHKIAQLFSGLGFAMQGCFVTEPRRRIGQRPKPRARSRRTARHVCRRWSPVAPEQDAVKRSVYTRIAPRWGRGNRPAFRACL